MSTALPVIVENLAFLESVNHIQLLLKRGHVSLIPHLYSFVKEDVKSAHAYQEIIFVNNHIKDTPSILKLK